MLSCSRISCSLLLLGLCCKGGAQTCEVCANGATKNANDTVWMKNCKDSSNEDIKWPSATVSEAACTAAGGARLEVLTCGNLYEYAQMNSEACTTYTSYAKMGCCEGGTPTCQAAVCAGDGTARADDYVWMKECKHANDETLPWPSASANEAACRDAGGAQFEIKTCGKVRGMTEMNAEACTAYAGYAKSACCQGGTPTCQAAICAAGATAKADDYVWDRGTKCTHANDEEINWPSATVNEAACRSAGGAKFETTTCGQIRMMAETSAEACTTYGAYSQMCCEGGTETCTASMCDAGQGRHPDDVIATKNCKDNNEADVGGEAAKASEQACRTAGGASYEVITCKKARAFMKIADYCTGHGANTKQWCCIQPPVASGSHQRAARTTGVAMILGLLCLIRQ